MVYHHANKTGHWVLGRMYLVVSSQQSCAYQIGRYQSEGQETDKLPLCTDIMSFPMLCSRCWYMMCTSSALCNLSCSRKYGLYYYYYYYYLRVEPYQKCNQRMASQSAKKVQRHDHLLLLQCQFVRIGFLWSAECGVCCGISSFSCVVNIFCQSI